MKPGRKDLTIGLSENEPITFRFKTGDPLTSLISSPDQVEFIVSWDGEDQITKLTSDATLDVDYSTGQVQWTPTVDEMLLMMGKAAEYKVRILFAAGPIRTYMVGYITVDPEG